MLIVVMIATMIIMLITMRIITMATQFRYLGSKAISRLLGAGLGKSREV